jgi:hypothetical protein
VSFSLFLSPTFPCVLLKVVFVPLELFYNAQVLTKFVLSSPPRTNRGVSFPLFSHPTSPVLPPICIFIGKLIVTQSDYR